MVEATSRQAEARWSGGVSPVSMSWNKLMMWIFIISDGLLFAGFLILTLIMILVDQLAVPRVLLVGFLLGAMLVKAGLIGANFMHLKFERRIVGVSVATALLFLGGILYLLMVPDGHRILRMAYTW